MATISKAEKCELNDNVCQGDIFHNVKYNYIDSEDNNSVDVVEYEFPLAIVISQGCDVISMSDMEIHKNGKMTKFMPSILMCPIYDETLAKNMVHLEDAFDVFGIVRNDSLSDKLYGSKEKHVVDKDWHYRYHSLTVQFNDKNVIENSLIDFKHYFTVPISYLTEHREDRLLRLEDIYSEQITLKFASFLARVAMPD